MPIKAQFLLVLEHGIDPQRVEPSFVFSPTLEGRISWSDALRVSFVPQQLVTNTLYAMTFTLRSHDTEYGSSSTAPISYQAFTTTFSTEAKGVPIPILMYHRLRELETDADQGQRDWTVSPSSFVKQLDYLAEHGYHTIDFDQLLAYIESQEPLPPRPVIISMDDGYRDVYDVAWSHLAERGFSACLFVLPDHVGYPAYLGWEQMATLRQAGFYFGSHSLNHPNLRKAGTEEAERQICTSKTLIEEKLKQPVTVFSYPLGVFDADIIALLKKCGYRAACTLASGYYQRTENDGVFCLKRVRVTYDTTLEDFASKLPWR